jgi:hypothetical protein
LHLVYVSGYLVKMCTIIAHTRRNSWQNVLKCVLLPHPTVLRYVFFSHGLYQLTKFISWLGEGALKERCIAVKLLGVVKYASENLRYDLRHVCMYVCVCVCV